MARRLLVIGTKLPRLKSVAWSEASFQNVVDYQGLLLDCRSDLFLPAMNLDRILEPYLRSGHPIFVILPTGDQVVAGRNELKFLPELTLKLNPVKGATVRLADTADTLIGRYCQALSQFEFIISPFVSGKTWTWANTVINNITQPICGRYGNVWVLHPPNHAKEEVALAAIVNAFGPDFEQPEIEKPPQWVLDLMPDLPGVKAIDVKTAEIEAQISALSASKCAETERRTELTRWLELLYLDGLAFQDRTRAALEFLGFQLDPENPTAHGRDLVARHGGRTFLIEVTGSSGSINIDKGRQLLQWVADADDIPNPKGVMIANAFRNLPPAKRPPSPDQRAFTSKLEEFAKRYHLALVDVQDLFDLVVRKLAGKPVDLDRVSTQLLGEGTVRVNAL